MKKRYKTCSLCGERDGYIAGMCTECMDEVYPAPEGHSIEEVRLRLKKIRENSPPPPPNILDLRNPRDIIDAVASGERVVKCFNSGQASSLGRMAGACCLVGEVPKETVDKVYRRYPFFGVLLAQAQKRFHTPVEDVQHSLFSELEIAT